MGDLREIIDDIKMGEETLIGHVRKFSWRKFHLETQNTDITKRAVLEEEISLFFGKRRETFIREMMTGKYVVSITGGCMDSINTLGMSVPEFEYEGTISDVEGVERVITRARRGISLSKFKETCDPETWNEMVPRLFRRMCEICDIMWKQSVHCPCFGNEDIHVLENGSWHLKNISETKIVSKADTNGIRDICTLLKFLAYGSPGEFGPRISRRFANEDTEITEFLSRGSCTDQRYALKNPICRLGFIARFVPSRVEFVSSCPYTSAPTRLAPVRDKCEAGETDERKNDARSKEISMIRSVLTYFETCADDRTRAHPVFRYHQVSDPLEMEMMICETWRVFLVHHSMWNKGPRGYHLNRSIRDKCAGCGRERCSFYNDTDCISVGRWMHNSEENHTKIPLPIDRVFLSSMGRRSMILSEMNLSEAEKEYDRLFRGRETFVRSMYSGLSYQRRESESHIDTICDYEPIDREKLMDTITVRFDGEKSSKINGWMTEWFLNSDEDVLKNFLMEATGTTVIRDHFTIVISRKKRDTHTSSDTCNRIIRIPGVNKRELFMAILDFRGPFVHTTHR